MAPAGTARGYRAPRRALPASRSPWFAPRSRANTWRRGSAIRRAPGVRMACVTQPWRLRRRRLQLEHTQEVVSRVAGAARGLAHERFVHLTGLHAFKQLLERHLDRGLVDHLARVRVSDRAEALGIRLLVQLDDLLRVRDLLVGRRVALVDDWNVGRMDRPAAIEAVAGRLQRHLAQCIELFHLEVDIIDRVDAGGLRRVDDALLGVEE